ncbi:MAG: response regulator transcription factor [Methylococcales bacterium]|nr:response regulator transcription factor [Methylococcales bacterium]
MVTQLNILVIEDHDQLREVTIDALTSHGYRALGIDCAEAIDDEMAGKEFDIYIIDLNLPGEDGLSLSRRIRDSHQLVGIIILTARMSVNDKLMGYGSGSDIYLTKPIHQAELLAVIDTLGRRIINTKRAMQSIVDVVFHLDTSTRFLNGPQGGLQLTKTEVSILSALNKAVTRQLETWQIIELLGENLETYPKSALEVRIARLRSKLILLGADKRSLLSLRDFGYSLTVPLRIY